MAERSYYEAKKTSPTTLALVVLLHGAALAALAMAKMDVEVMKVFEPIKVTTYQDPPPPEPLPQPKAEPQPRSKIDFVPPVVPTPPRNSDPIIVDRTPNILVFNPNPPGLSDPKPVVIPGPPAAPVRTEAELRSSSALQPDYPAAEMRAENEGKVVIRVTIGADGRVKGASRVSATSDAFYRATERHAMRAWRFKPATVDGKPVESEKVITVYFRLDD